MNKRVNICEDASIKPEYFTCQLIAHFVLDSEHMCIPYLPHALAEKVRSLVPYVCLCVCLRSFNMTQ